MGKHTTSFSLLEKAFNSFVAERGVEVEENNVLELFAKFVTSSSSMSASVAKSTASKPAREKTKVHPSSLDELEESWTAGKGLCAYTFGKGDNKGKFCGAAAKNVDTASNFKEFRCQQCLKKGVSKTNKSDSSVKKVVAANKKESINMTKAPRVMAASNLEPLELKTRSVSGLNDNHVFGKSEDVVNFLFEMDDDEVVACLGKVSPTYQKKGYLSHLKSLAPSEQKSLKRYKVTYRAPDNEGTSGVSETTKAADKKIVKAIESDSDSDATPSPKVAAKKSTPPEKPLTKKPIQAHEDTDSESDSDSSPKVAAKKPTSPEKTNAASKKTSSREDSDSDSTPSSKVVAKKPTPPNKKEADTRSNSSDSSSESGSDSDSDSDEVAGKISVHK